MNSSGKHVPAKPKDPFWTRSVVRLSFILFVVITTSEVREHYGSNAVYAAVAILMIPGFCFLYWDLTANRRQRERRRLLRERYQYVYRVLALPPELSTFDNHPLAKIEVGDYGWEAPPLADDGLIYLQGLTPDWKLVWHAGFHPDQIEKVGLKPQSQYDCAEQNELASCPYPIMERQTQDLGLPS